MKNILMLCAIIFSLMPFQLSAQSDTIGWGKNSNYNRKYDVNTVTEIKGEVTAVEQVVPMNGMSSGIHIMVKTGSETISVHLGPKWYLEKQAVQIKVNDKVMVIGSKIILEEKPVIIAREIHKGDMVLKLRDANGIPEWAGWKFK